MKEIKFRGMSYKGEWIYGSLINGDAGYYIAWTFPKNDLYGFEEVNPMTVGQFTGLKDKNGREIYEADIIDNRDGKYIIYYSVKWGRWLCVAVKSYYDWLKAGEPMNEYSECFGFDNDESQYSEVIGNIYENPGLLGNELQ